MYGKSKQELNMKATGESWTYKASDMCGPDANTTGFRDPGYMYDVLLQKLQPMTMYFYSYGSEGVRLKTSVSSFLCSFNYHILVWVAKITPCLTSDMYWLCYRILQLPYQDFVSSTLTQQQF